MSAVILVLSAYTGVFLMGVAGWQALKRANGVRVDVPVPVAPANTLAVLTKAGA